jgi:hypothetical protein
VLPGLPLNSIAGRSQTLDQGKGMDTRTWTYAEVTLHLENEIERHMKQAHLSRSETGQEFHRDHAFGIYLAWEALVADEIGVHVEDSNRLMQLINSTVPPKKTPPNLTLVKNVAQLQDQVDSVSKRRGDVTDKR